jgi:hypothetical protein
MIDRLEQARSIVTCCEKPAITGLAVFHIGRIL